MEQPYGPYPTLVEQASGRVVPVVEAYAHTKYLGHLTLDFDEDGEVTVWEGNPILLNKSFPQGKETSVNNCEILLNRHSLSTNEMQIRLY